MFERYSHIRMAAKRDAVVGISLRVGEENFHVVPVKVPAPEQSPTVEQSQINWRKASRFRSWHIAAKYVRQRLLERDEQIARITPDELKRLIDVCRDHDDR